jgi:hypothetical protein
MSKEYSITFRKLENKTNIHIQYLEEENDNFCMIHPYFVNVNLGDDVRCLLCDGEYVVDVTEWSGIGLSFSEEVKPSEKSLELIHDYIFELK